MNERARYLITVKSYTVNTFADAAKILGVDSSVVMEKYFKKESGRRFFFHRRIVFYCKGHRVTIRRYYT